MVTVSTINRLSRAVDLLENWSQHGRLETAFLVVMKRIRIKRWIGIMRLIPKIGAWIS
jgi:hypothetical protein